MSFHSDLSRVAFLTANISTSVIMRLVGIHALWVITIGLSVAVLVAPVDEPFQNWVQYANFTVRLALKGASIGSVVAIGVLLLACRIGGPRALSLLPFHARGAVVLALATLSLCPVRWLGATTHPHFAFTATDVYLPGTLGLVLQMCGHPLVIVLLLTGCTWRIGATWLHSVVLARRGTVGLCLRCGYDVAGLSRCPECGAHSGGVT